jgi:Transposase DDE domain
MQYTLNRSHLHQLTVQTLRDQLQLHDYSPTCSASTLLAVLLVACARFLSPSAAADWLRTAPSRETVRQALLDNLPDCETLQDRLNRALIDHQPRLIRRLSNRARQGRRVAKVDLVIDLTLIPYHGEPLLQEDEVYRGQPKGGTTHFHAYATVYLVLHGSRYTLAQRYVRQGEKMDEIVRFLLQRCAAQGIRPRLVLLDRGFWQVGVIRYLQAARYPFLMPVICRGRKADHPDGPGGTRVFTSGRRSGLGCYQLQETGSGRKATVSIAVQVRNRAGRRGQYGREALVYAFWGWHPSSAHQVSERYRRRFAIETSYRQMNQARARTSTRNPAVRLLLVGLALVLRNVWVWLHEQILGQVLGNGRVRVHLEILPFKQLLGMLEQVVIAVYGTIEEVPAQVPTETIA